MFFENLNFDLIQVAQSFSGQLRKCPRCMKPAKVSTIKIRRSPRKKKKRNISDIPKISSGRVQKPSKTFLAKPSIDSHYSFDQLYVTFPMLDERSNSNSPSTSSSGESPHPPSSDESASSGNEFSTEAESYEFGVCSGISCNFKFCVKCNCKYHPRQLCKELSPASPSRSHRHETSVACTSLNRKSLKRLTKFY